MKINNNLFSIDGKVVCITGSSRGLGKTLGYYFVSGGAQVVLSSQEEKELQEAAREFEMNHSKVDIVVSDVSKWEDCENLVHEILTMHGRIDVMICNAGMDIIKPAIDYSEAEWDKILDVNLRGAYYCAKFAAQEMIKQKSGTIIMTSSIAGNFGISGLAPYAASKAGINQLVKSLAVEWAEYGIRVNGIAPGYIDNIMKEVAFDPNDLYQQKILSRTLMHRRGGLEEFAGAYLFLSSEAASYITGQTLIVDGGYSCW
jgi:NAD(P)-dependent dehydrogenase (short-subunit alcohol dehydrogenase family)